jgi:ERAP1-like C-terminal domain
MADILAAVNGMYGGDPVRRDRAARYAIAKLGPVLHQRLGWSARPSERAADSVLREELIDTLGTIGDPVTVAEANRRFNAGDASITAGPLRLTILGVVALNATPEIWERLRVMARDERNPLVRVQLYQLLGSVRDERLARRALDLALTDEPGATNASQLISSVSGEHPDLAFDFALRNRERVEGLVDASSRSRYFAGLASGSVDPAMIGKLTNYAERYMTPQSRGPADRAIASIRDRLRVREQRLPDITRWLEARGG